MRVEENAAFDIYGPGAELTISIWVYADQLTSYHFIADKENNRNGSETQYSLYVGNDGVIYFDNCKGGLYGGAWSSANALTVGQWHHVVATYAGQGAYGEVTGKAVATVRYLYNGMNNVPGAYNDSFVMDSNDDGQTWSTPRQLTTEYGQCYSSPIALRDGTVVVVYETRLGPGSPGNRAMVSRDGGWTWLDEAYYLDSSVYISGYSTSIELNDGNILTISASNQANPFQLDTSATDLYAIIWRPVPVPEPSTLLMVLIAAGSLLMIYHRRKIVELCRLT